MIPTKTSTTTTTTKVIITEEAIAVGHKTSLDHTTPTTTTEEKQDSMTSRRVTTDTDRSLTLYRVGERGRGVGTGMGGNRKDTTTIEEETDAKEQLTCHKPHTHKADFKDILL